MLLLSFLTVLSLSVCRFNSLYQQMFDNCRNHNEINLSKITDFDWDIAYIDRQYYGSGEIIKEKYQIEGEFKHLETDFSSRIAFCKEGKLVYDIKLNNHYIEIDSSNEIIYIDTIFKVSWITVDDQNENKLLLSLY